MLMIKIYQTTQITEALQGYRLRRKTEDATCLRVTSLRVTREFTFVSLLVSPMSLRLSGLQWHSLMIIMHGDPNLHLLKAPQTK